MKRFSQYSSTIFVPIVVVLLFSMAGLAEEISSSGTWQQLRLMALSSNPTYISSKQAFKSQIFSSKAGFNRLFPSVNLTGSYAESDALASGDWSARALAQMDLFNASKIAEIRGDSASLGRSLAQFRLTSAEVRYELRKAFVSLLVAQESLIVTERIREIRRANAETVSLKYESGRESKGNRMLVMAELLSAETDVERARRTLHVAQRELNALLGEKDFAVRVVTGTLNLGVDPARLEQKIFLTAHPRILKLTADVNAARAIYAGARSSMWPSLSASYSRSANGDSFFPENEHWNLLGSLSLPVFSGGPSFSYYSQKAAQQSLEQALSNLTAEELGLQRDVEVAWASLSNANDVLRVRGAFLEATRQREIESTIRYSMGTLSFDDWERTVADLVNTELNVIQSLREALIAEAQWDRVQAVSLEDL